MRQRGDNLNQEKKPFTIYYYPSETSLSNSMKMEMKHLDGYLSVWQLPLVVIIFPLHWAHPNYFQIY